MFSFVATNQLDSALSEAQRAAQIDPMAMSYNVGWMLQAAGRHTEARRRVAEDARTGFDQRQRTITHRTIPGRARTL